MGAMTGGVVYPPNLTPDPDTGLGRWTDEQIMRAIRTGQRPDGRMLVPVMPWPSYATLTDEDARAIVAYLRSIPAVRFKAPAPVKPDEKSTAPYLKVVHE
jgi:mono/diheme cytochrome c family protein